MSKVTIIENKRNEWKLLKDIPSDTWFIAEIGDVSGLFCKVYDTVFYISDNTKVNSLSWDSLKALFQEYQEVDVEIKIISKNI